jgi:type VI protein secretion system component Hcp
MNLHRNRTEPANSTATWYLAVLLAACGLVISGAAVAAQTILLSITGPAINGNSGDSRCPTCIRLSAYSQTVQNTPPAGTGGGAGAGLGVCGPVTVTKSIDTSSNVLVVDTLVGTHFTQATIYFYNDSTPQDFYQIDLSPVVIQSVTTSDNRAGGIVEQVVLVATQFVYTYRPQLPDGGAGPPIVQGYDCARQQRL